jgi:ribosome-binding ATPase YchF (GTP1/OBG family)
VYSVFKRGSSASCRRGELIRTGVKVAIVGRPNAGKSSLLNVLAARDAAIVSSTPGTTRDTVEVSVDLAGQKVRHLAKRMPCMARLQHCSLRFRRCIIVITTLCTSRGGN